METSIHNGLVLQFGSYAEKYLKELEQEQWEKDNTDPVAPIKQSLKYTPRINRFCNAGWRKYLKNRKARTERRRANLNPECVPLYKAFYSNTSWM